MDGCATLQTCRRGSDLDGLRRFWGPFDVWASNDAHLQHCCALRGVCGRAEASDKLEARRESNGIHV